MQRIRPGQLILLVALFVSMSTLSCRRSMTSGLTSKGSKRSKPRKVKDINARFTKPGVSASEWKKKFERHNRDVFRHRREIVKQIRIKKGQSVADIGAGTGAFLKLFVEAVGKKGTVFAVEIAPAFVRYLKQQVKKKKYHQVKVVFSTTTSTKLPTNSVDHAFVCDTYHHFGQYAAMLKDIHRILRPNGRLVIVDFHRIPGVSEPWILGHVKYNQQQVIQQITTNGFELERKVKMPQLKENYYIVFKRKAATQVKQPKNQPI